MLAESANYLQYRKKINMTKRNVFTLALALLTWTAFAVLTAADEEAATGQEVVEKSMHEFMEYVFQPTYKRLKVTMKEEVTEKSGWKALKSDSLILAESCNLLLLRAPEENAADWNAISAETRQLGAELYRAAGKKDFATATTKYRAMLTKCNACHNKFADGEHQLSP